MLDLNIAIAMLKAQPKIHRILITREIFAVNMRL